MIRIRNLFKSFGPKMIYYNLNLTVEDGETRVIIGRSGEGKSVLLKHICALLEPDAGTIKVGDQVVDRRDKTSVRYVRNKVSMVFQNAALFDSLSVRENVGFYLDERGEKPKEDIEQIVETLLEEV